MALLQDLIQQIEDPVLRDRLTAETDKLLKQKRFGLVFEEHLPECTPLYEVPIRVGGMVAKKTGYVSDIFLVTKIEDDAATCLNRESREESIIPLEELVTVAQFGEAIYPYLKPLDTVCNAPDSELWHTLIEADNYHALQLLEYLYTGKVDCIYIDPPYNNRKKDWKYNNDYVDPLDTWHHSKWLSMMQKRLRIAKKLLNPSTGVLIVTIDENEVQHLRMLLDELFSDAIIQMVTIVINPKGNTTKGRFSRVEEYAIFCFMPNAYVNPGTDSLLGGITHSKKPRWKGLLSSGEDSRRGDREKMFYPILIDPTKKKIIKALSPLPLSEKPNYEEKIEGYEVAWPIRSDLSEGRWMLGQETFNDLLKKGYVSLGKYDDKRKTWSFSYLTLSLRKQIETGEILITDRNPITNTVKIEYASEKSKQIMTVWHRSLHDAGAYGSDMVSAMVGETRAFSFPKSLYSTKDAVASIVRNNKTALIIDFFAGSGTTLNAVNLLNAEDGGSRRCILVTNNETSNEEAIELTKAGFKAGDPEWETHGIAHSVTWPRIKNTITGRRSSGMPLKGEYITATTQKKEKSRSFTQISFVEDYASLSLADKKQLSSVLSKQILPQNLINNTTKYIVSDEDEHNVSILFDDSAADEWLEALDGMTHISEFYIITKSTSIFKNLKKSIAELLGNIIIEEPLRIPMADGFKANAAFFKLGFLDKTRVALGTQFKELLPVIWMKAGAIGCCPALDSDTLPDMLILPQNHFAVLLEEPSFKKFSEELAKHPEIDTVFIVTDSVNAYREMIRSMDGKQTYQLYRDYLDNFRINTGR